MPEQRGSYEAAGVSIERGERAVDLMRSAVEATHGPEVVPYPGGFAGLYALAGYREPVLASTTDSVGTKVLVAKEVGRYDLLGADIVNHCANDVLASGARPIFFLDYIGIGEVVPEAVAGIVREAARACAAAGMSLVGGETAEMPDLYSRGDLDVVGLCVGASERPGILTGAKVRAGDAVLGLASSGLHTNGYTLARKVVAESNLSYSDSPEGLGESIGEAYLKPHRAYVREVEALRSEVEVRGMAHITQGGVPGNLARSLGGLGAVLDASSWREPPVFDLVRTLGRVPEDEMRRVFNLGVGFCAVVPEGAAERGVSALRDAGCEAWRIGEVVEGGGVQVA